MTEFNDKTFKRFFAVIKDTVANPKISSWSFMGIFLVTAFVTTGCKKPATDADGKVYESDQSSSLRSKGDGKKSEELGEIDYYSLVCKNFEDKSELRVDTFCHVAVNDKKLEKLDDLGSQRNWSYSNQDFESEVKVTSANSGPYHVKYSVKGKAWEDVKGTAESLVVELSYLDAGGNQTTLSKSAKEVLARRSDIGRRLTVIHRLTPLKLSEKKFSFDQWQASSSDNESSLKNHGWTISSDGLLAGYEGNAKASSLINMKNAIDFEFDVEVSSRTAADVGIVFGLGESEPRFQYILSFVEGLVKITGPTGVALDQKEKCLSEFIADKGITHVEAENMKSSIFERTVDLKMGDFYWLQIRKLQRMVELRFRDPAGHEVVANLCLEKSGSSKFGLFAASDSYTTFRNPRYRDLKPKALSYQVKASVSAETNISYSFAQAPPPGLTINPDGRLMWPAENMLPGQYPLKLLISNGQGSKNMQNILLDISW